MPLLQIYERPDGITVYLAPLGVWTQWKKLLAIVPLGIAAGLMAYAREYVPAVMSGLFVLVNGVSCLVVASRRASFSVHGDHLTITTRFRLVSGGRRTSIHRDQIIALNAVGGLRIVTLREELCLFSERELQETARLASLLRQALHLFEEVPLREQELRVSFTGPLWRVPTPGILAFRAGELTLRNPFQAGPFFVFSARSGPRPRWAYGSTLNVMRLEPHEIVGRAPKGKPNSLVIAPTTALFLRRNYTIPAGIAGPRLRTIFFWTPITFQIFCEDGNALHAALATFWNKSDLVAKL